MQALIQLDEITFATMLNKEKCIRHVPDSDNGESDKLPDHPSQYLYG